MKKKAVIVNVTMAVIMSALMGALAAFLVRLGSTEQQLSTMPPAPVMYFLNIVESVIVGILLVLILPLGRMGTALASKAKATPPSFKFTLLNSLPVSVISAIICSFAVCLINIIQAHSRIPADVAPPLVIMFMGQWLKLLPPSIIISYVASVLISPLVVRAAGLGGPDQAQGHS